jgi:cation diffusion facilitator family transporter
MEILIRKFIKDYGETERPDVRERYGELSGIVGVSINLLLCAAKLCVGILSGAISVIADAIHNLSDAGSSIVTLLGFKLAAKPADPEHPFGHGRIEYISGLIISAAILFVGIELFRTSLDKILHPEELAVTEGTILILVLSIFFQLWLGRFNQHIGRSIGSAAIEAAAADSLNDCVATAVVILSLIVHYVAGVNIDGIAGMLVAGFILHSGWCAARDTLQPLLGQAPKPEFVKELEEAVLSEDKICGVHDLIVHDYGPGRVFVSLHAEIPSTMNIMKAHELMDKLEVMLHVKFHIEVTVHMDPVVVDDPEINHLRELVQEAVKGTEASLSMHDFRMTTTYHGGRNLIFDVVVPFTCGLHDDEVRRQIRQRIAGISEDYHAVIRIDRLYSTDDDLPVR